LILISAFPTPTQPLVSNLKTIFLEKWAENHVSSPQTV
jgi:hypothetical protein